MSEVEDFKAGREARAGVVHRAARSPGQSEVVQRMVEAAVYRATHHAEPDSSTEDIAAATALTREPAMNRDKPATNATRTVVSTFGLLAGLAGIEHGVGEILQGSVRPEGPVIESWPDSKAFEILAGEPAMTVIPNLLVTGIVAVIVAVAVAIWSVRFVDRRHGGLVLILLCVLLLLVGGGFGPPLIGVIIGFGATRIGVAPGRRPGRVSQAVGQVWPWVLGAAVLGYLSLLPGTILLGQLLGVDNPGLVYALSAFSFAGLILALAAARAADHVRAG